MPLRRSFPPPDSSIRGAPRTCHSHLAESKASACASVSGDAIYICCFTASPKTLHSKISCQTSTACQLYDELTFRKRELRQLKKGMFRCVPRRKAGAGEVEGYGSWRCCCQRERVNFHASGSGNNVLLREKGGWGQTLSVSGPRVAAKGTDDPRIPMKLATRGQQI